MLRVFIYYLLNSLSVIGDSLFLYFITLTLLQTGHGGMLCSLVLGMDAFLEIVVGPYLARFIDAIPTLASRLRRSLLIQVWLMGLAFLPAWASLVTSHKCAFLIGSFAFMRFFFLIDTQLRAGLPLSLDKEGKISLIRILSLSTFSGRCIFLVSATLSPLLIGRSWFFASALNSMTYIFSFLALMVILRLARSSSFEKKQEEGEESLSTHSEEEKKGWVVWNCLYYFLGSFSLGGVGLILTKSMALASNRSFLFQALRGPSPLYAGGVVALILMMIWHRKGEKWASTGERLCIQLFILGTGLIVTACAPSHLQGAILFIFGIFNAFSIVASEAFLQRKSEGKRFVKALAKSQAFGRVGFLLSVACIGYGIDLGWNPSQLLVIAGVAAIGVATLLFFLATSVEKGTRVLAPFRGK